MARVNSQTLKIKRFFTKKNIHPYQEVKWIKTTALIPGKDRPSFEQKNVEFPSFYSQNAINIIASKYFRVKDNKQENSLKQIINRVVKTLRKWGEKQKYFNAKEGKIFEDELTYIILHQIAWFNSPVWFNLGIREKPQCSACFILAVEDSMESILNWIKTEGMIFKGGSGSGVNLSSLRAEGEPLSTGGHSSGPISFMRAADAVAGSIKSGGATRRAAKMVILDVDHPDIIKFIRLKAEEEDKVRALISAGYDMSDLNNPLWQNINFQNQNNSVRLTDEFMKKALQDEDWLTYYRTSKKPAQKYKAKEILWEIAKSAWECGDPGVQFEDTIQKWNTCKNSGRITASNPCSEYLFLDYTSCNLASINLLKFLTKEGKFDAPAFRQTVDIVFLAQEIIVDNADYPTKEIAHQTKKFRAIGLGYANLGALLMALALPYDSDSARAWASTITALMTGEAYRISALLAKKLGPFPEFKKNQRSMLKVIEMHQNELKKINKKLVDKQLFEETQNIWQEVVELGKKYGFRNAQATLLAPTGTISLAMDCATTGIEPDFSLVKIKYLVGGGSMKLVNPVVEIALKRLGYSKKQIKDIVNHLEKTQNIESAPYLKKEHLPIFDCAVKPPGGTRSIHWTGHVKMVSAVQPFLSGGISKTFNMPNETTIEEVYNAFISAWKLGIKCFSIYRDGSKASQPLQTAKQKEKQTVLTKKKLPIVRLSETHKFSIAGQAGYLTYSFFEDGSLGEIFIVMSKQGSTLAGLLDAFAIAVSIALQYGVPLKELAKKFIHMRFEPMGITNNPDIQFASSIIDYIFRYLAKRFLTEEDLKDLGLTERQELPEELKYHRQLFQNSENKENFSGMICRKCGGLMIRTGSCYTCISCGENSGGCG